MTPSNQATPQPAGHWVNLLVVCLCFILSGVAALVYQIVWTRQFSLVFGTSELAVAAILAAYMGGLALGAYLIEKCIRRIVQPVLWYAGLELGIALAAWLVIPAGLRLAEYLLIHLFGGQADPANVTLTGAAWFYLLAAFVVLLIPTTLMGATLPLLARHAVHSEQQIGRRVGLLYACNTAGAVAGALLGALVLLPKFGLMKTVWVAAGVNLFVAALALTLSKTTTNRILESHHLDDLPSKELPERLRVGASPAWVLPLMLLSGAVSFLHEVLWTRMLGHILGSGITAFGVMLASFLAGIAMGGGLGALLARRRADAARWLALGELAAALAAIGAWYVIQQFDMAVGTLLQRALFGFGVLLPLAFAIGLTYPLAVRVLACGVGDAASASARVYSWNTVGAIVGAVAAGFLIVPALRYEGSVQLAVITSCLLACVATFALFRPTKWFAIPITLAAFAAAIGFMPKQPEALLRFSPLHVSGEGELLYYDVGRSATVAVLRQGDQLAMRTNGLPEASIDIVGSTPQLYVEAWMAPLAMLARPQLQDMLVVGLGGGRVLEAVPPSVRHIDVIELESKVIDANRHIARRRLQDPLSDHRVNFIVNDARGALQLTVKKYDAIVSQPSHPWTAGASHLYTREFMQQAKDHLRPGGVFVQWMNVDFLDESLLRSLVATLNAVYPQVRVYHPAPPTLLFLASDAPIEPERHIAATHEALAAAPGHYGRLGLNAVEDLIVSLAMDNQGSRAFAAGAAIITDDNNRFATANVYDFGHNISTEKLGHLLAPYDPLLQPGSFIYRELRQQLAFDYVARRIHAYTQFDISANTRMEGLADLLRDPAMQVYVHSLMQHGDLPSQQALTNGADLHPNSELLHDALLESRLVVLGSANAVDDVNTLVNQGGEHGNMPLRAAQFAARSDWSSVAQLDAALAQIPWTSLWKAQAVRWRVEWRLRVRDPALRSRFSADSIAMIDRISIIQPNLRLYVLRALSSIAANQPQTLLESISRYCQLLLQGTVTIDDSARSDFDSLRPLFEQLRHDDRIDAQRYREVEELVTGAAAKLL